VDSDGQFQFDENRVYDGPDRINFSTMQCEASHQQPLDRIRGDVHQIRYKPTQRKNSKAEKMFPGVPAVLCPEGLMQSAINTAWTQ
jgi:hypothetical protein